jgi:hypothetical protein
MLLSGGPGGSGVNFLVLAAPFLAELIGDDWDLIGFDPRGVGLTTYVTYISNISSCAYALVHRPKVQCFPNTLTQHLFLSNTIFEQGITVPNPQNLSDARNYASLVEQQRQFLALKKAQADLCADNMDTNDLRFMGTATVVRDMDFMTRLLDGPDAKMFPLFPPFLVFGLTRRTETTLVAHTALFWVPILSTCRYHYVV